MGTGGVQIHGSIRIIVLIVVAAFQAACSTPPVVEQQEEPETAWEAYLSCLQRVRNTDLCDNVGTNGAYSYNQYTYGSDSNSYNGAGLVAGNLRAAADVSAASKSLLDQAYKEYLRSLEPSDFEQLAVQWRELDEVKEIQ